MYVCMYVCMYVSIVLYCIVLYRIVSYRIVKLRIVMRNDTADIFMLLVWGWGEMTCIHLLESVYFNYM